MKKGRAHLLQERWQIYGFIASYKHLYPIERMVFKVSSNNFYRCHPTDPSNQVMEHSLFKDLIQKKFELNKQRYGSTRIAEQLKRKGYCISRCRVAKIMKVNHWVSKHKRKFKATTDSHHNYPVCRNLLNRNFTPGRLNAAWISDIT